MRNPNREQNEKAQRRRAGHPESVLFEGDDMTQREKYKPLILTFCTSKYTCKMALKPYQLDEVLYYCARFLALLYSVFSSEHIIRSVSRHTTNNVQTWERYLVTVLPQKMRASEGKIDRVLGNWKYFTSYVINGHDPRHGTDTNLEGLKKYRLDYLRMKRHWDESAD